MNEKHLRIRETLLFQKKTKKKCKQEKFLLRMTYEQGLKAERHNKQQVAASLAIYVGLFCYDHRYKKILILM